MALRGEAHPKAKLTDNQVLKIRELFEKGFSLRVIARNFKVSDWNVRSIVKGKTWKHLNLKNKIK
jgi:predicted DNA-binding protein YlxM (UPF0122 family)